jgi:hypothetical protein
LGPPNGPMAMSAANDTRLPQALDLPTFAEMGLQLCIRRCGITEAPP